MMTPTMEELAVEQAGLELARFDLQTAWELGSRIRDIAAERQLPISIEVCHGATPAFFVLMPGATPDNLDWVRRKRAVALRFHQSSLYMRLLCESKSVDFHDRFRLPREDFAASGGGVPIFVAGIGVVGAAAVSGLPDVEDHRLVISALQSLRRAPD